MERCKFTPQRLSIYIDGQCSDKEKAVIKKHISECPNCQEELLFLLIAKSSLKTLSNVKIPHTLDNGIADKLHK
jgi:predicted anti-sigma-YlaC factor YlaD